MKYLLTLTLALAACGGGPKLVAVSAVAEACERIEQRVEDQNPCTTDLETVQGQLACTRTACDALMHEIETSGGED